MLTYEEARRAARLRLGEKAELQELKDAPVYKFVVGMRVKGKFIPMGAGATWDEALADLRKQKDGEA